MSRFAPKATPLLRSSEMTRWVCQAESAGARKVLPELIDARAPWIMSLQRSRFTLGCLREVFIEPKQQEVSGWNEEQRQQRRDSNTRHHENGHRLRRRAH